jgi:hypothetical protein
MKINFFIYTSILILLINCNTPKAKIYEDSIRREMKIEHVFSVPSNAHLPGTVLQYTEASGYQRVCFPYETLNIQKEDYMGLLKESKMADSGSVSSNTINFNMDLTAEEVGKASTEFKRISGMRLVLKNGRQMEAEVNLGKLFKNLKDESNACNQSIKTILEIRPEGKIILVMTMYAYDLSYSLNVDNNWRSDIELTALAKEKISSKLNMNMGSNSDLQLSGEKLYIGFNGLPAPVDKITFHKIGKENTTMQGLQSMLNNTGSTKEKIRSLDLTEIFSKK